VTSSEIVDVLIVGAGLSGVGAAVHLQQRCPGKSYVILEGRESMGGTWDLFRYPGIRSDSDMYTLGYSFRPWTDPKAIADGSTILEYIRDTARSYGVDRNVRYGHRVVAARWSSDEALWTVDAEQVATGETVSFKCRFLHLCAGYYRYDHGYMPDYPGRERFRGKVVHPQQWTSDIEFAGKRVVVIGSGATAVTLVPELAETAAHVTMLQRTPTYVVSAPERDRVADWLRGRIDGDTAYAITRWKNVLLNMATFAYARGFPDEAARFIVSQVKKQVGDSTDVQKHFAPAYKPWDQRVCLVPDGDLFRAVREGRASVVTDTIDTFTEEGLELASGDVLAADLVVSATGLELLLFGGMKIEVDGREVDPPKTMAYKGMMLSDVPNLAFAIGYTNASWTLKCDLTAEYVCRLLNHMDARGATMCCPRRNDPRLKEEPLIGFSSGYVQRAIHKFPRQGSIAPWRLYQNYALDRLTLRHSPIEDGSMELR
jgi:cation diffusion facilitator CzcD-associated flavoprotein CzcO